MKKRILSMFIAVLMVALMIPFSALTAFAVSSGSGTEGDPLYVTTFAELKTALQSTEDTYIVVEEFKNTTGLSYYDYSGDYENNGFAITIPANYKKHLTVNTTIKLHTSVTNKVCYAFIGNAGNLTIQGTGSISVNFNNGQHTSVPGAIIYNQYPAVLTVNDSVTLNANDLQVTTPMRSNPGVIYNYSGTVNIYGGTFKAYGTSDLTGYERATIAVINRGENAAKINIYGGTFSATNIISSLVNYGILADDGVKLYGGVFHGIKTDTTLNTLLASDQYNYIDTSDSSVFSPNDSLTETSKILRVRSSTQYNIAVEGGIANVSVACAGDIVTLTAATPPIGKVFDKWEVVSGEIEISGNTFEMPANNVSVKATYKDTPTYTVTFHNGYGSGTMAPVTGVQGEYTLPECSFTAPTRKQFKAWNVGGTEYAVGDKISVTTDVTVTAVWEEIITKITNIDITITEPKLAKNVIDTSMDYSLNTDALASTVCYWYESTNGVSWTPLLDGDFKDGKYYKAQIYLTRRDYQEYDSNVLVTVNGGIPDSKVIEDSMLIITKVWGPLKMTVDSIELEVAKPVIGEAPTKPTIKSVNMDENLKDLVSFYSDSKVFWVETDSAEDIANGNKNPTVFADDKIYALHVAIQSTKEIAEDCVLNVYGTDGELLWSGNLNFSDPSDKTLVYTDAYLGNFKHTHTYTNSVLQKDDTHHWLECDATACPDKFGSIKDKVKHTFSTDFKTDAENHWKECACGAKTENGAHSGGTATCTAKAKCEICNADYGSVATHTHGTEFKTDADNHWNECACGDKANVAPHADSNNDGKCDVCSYAMPKVEENDPSAPTPDLPNTNTDKPTDATESEKDDSTETEAPANNGCGGCGSSAALSVIAIVAVVGSALVIKKKKD